MQAWARLEVEQDPVKARTLMEAAVKAEPFNLKLWQSYERLEKLISGEGSPQVSSHMMCMKPRNMFPSGVVHNNLF